MARNIFAILDDMAASIGELRGALAPLTMLAGPGKAAAPAARAPRKRRAGRPRKAAAAPAAKAAAAPEGAAAPAAKPARKAKAARKGAPSPKRALQGKYMVALRKLSKADQAEVKKMRAEQGVEAALKLAAGKVA